MRTLPGPSNPKRLTQCQLSIRKFACRIMRIVESKEAALAGCLLPNGATASALSFAFDNANANQTWEEEPL